jgi:hypothetical protein
MIINNILSSALSSDLSICPSSSSLPTPSPHKMQTDAQQLVLQKDAPGTVEFMKNVFLSNCPEDNEVAALGKVNEFLKACTTNAAEKLQSLAGSSAVAPTAASAAALGKVLLKLDNLQFMEPRGRFSTCFYEKGMTFTNKTFCGTLLWDSMLTLVCVLNTMTPKKDIEDFMVMHFTPQKVNGKTIKNVLFAVSRVAGCPREGGGSQSLQGN